MARNSKSDPNTEKKAQQVGKLFDTFVDGIKTKQQYIKAAASEARRALRSVQTSQKKSLNELGKIKTQTSKDIAAIGHDVSNEAERLKTTAKAAFSEVDTIRNDTKKSYNRFKRTYDASLNGESGIVARREDIANRHDKIKKIHEAIDGLASKAQEQTSAINTAHADSIADRDQVAKVRSRAEEIRSEIEQTYQIATDGAMGGALNQRKVEIQGALYFWRRALIVAVLLLVSAIGLLIYISVHAAGETSLLTAVTNRLVYLTPLLFVIFIAYRQYGHERRLLEEYAFKAALAQTLRNYAVLLSDNYKQADGAEEKILDFLLKTMTNIYDRSSLDNTSGFFYQFIVGSKQLGAQATVQEGMAEIKETTSKKIETKTLA